MLNFVFLEKGLRIVSPAIIRTGITCKKIPCYICATQPAGGLLLKKAKIF